MQISILADNVVTLYVYISDLKKIFSLFILNWKIIALQYCIGFYQTSAWISHRFTKPVSPPTWASLPPPSLFHNSRLSQSPWLEFPESYRKFSLAIYFTYGNVCFPGLPGGSEVKASACVCLQCGRPGFDSLVEKIFWRRKWQPTPVFLPGESHWQRSLMGCSPRGCKESDTNSLSLSLSLSMYVSMLLSPCLPPSFLPPPKCVYNFVT